MRLINYNFKINILILYLIFLGLGFSKNIEGQTKFHLTPIERKHLVLIAREGVEAHIDGRVRLLLTPNPRLDTSRGMVVSFYGENGILLRRAWRLSQAKEMSLSAGDLAVKAAFDENNYQQAPLSTHEARKARIRVSVLSDYTRVSDLLEIRHSDAIVVQTGFLEGVALPDDVKINSPENKLAFACQSIGLNPNAWLLDNKIVIMRAKLFEMQESSKTSSTIF